MDRRWFLKGLGAVALSQVLGACQQNNHTVLEVKSLQKTLPPQLIDKFRSQSQVSIQLGLVSSPQATFSQLQKWHGDPQPPSAALTLEPTEPGKTRPSRQRLVSLGDYWLPKAIQQQLLQPLPVSEINRWSDLPPRWQQLVRRDRTGRPSPTGEVWGAPYRWGATLIAYRTDKFKDLGWEPKTWTDLWRPELQGHISLLDQPREVIGLTLKKLEQSYNLENLESVPELAKELEALNDQVRFYASSHYLEPLILKDTWVAVGWSGDILPVLAQEPDIQAVLPESGTALSADLWVQSATPMGDLKAVSEWINFWWDDTVATDLSQFTSGISPFKPQQSMEKSPSHLLLAHPDRIDRSELLLPLPTSTIQQYQHLWQRMRTPS